MANQYSGSLESLAINRFHRPLVVILGEFSEQGLTIDEVAKRFGVGESCICRWLKRFNLKLAKRVSNDEQPIKESRFDEFQKLLCRRWRSI